MFLIFKKETNECVAKTISNDETLDVWYHVNLIYNYPNSIPEDYFSKIENDPLKITQILYAFNVIYVSDGEYKISC